jgi:hypothetical protein
VVGPGAWTLDHALLDRPGNDEIRLWAARAEQDGGGVLFRDPANVELCPAVHRYFRDSRVPLPAAWGASDEIFGPGGPRAFQQDLPDAGLHLVESGHAHLRDPALRAPLPMRGVTATRRRAPLPRASHGRANPDVEVQGHLCR